MTDAASKAREIIRAHKAPSGYILYGDIPVLEKAIAAAISAAVAEEHALREAETDEYDALLRQINKNLEPMAKAWQEATGQPEVSPGTPTLVKWWQGERERAGKLVEAAKNLRAINPHPHNSKSDCEGECIWGSFDAALQAYEVSHE